MSRPYRSYASEDLRRAWALLHEHQGFHRLAQHREKLEEKYREKRIPWKSMIRAVFSQSMTIDENQENEIDEMPSQNNVERFLQNEIEENLDECWFEINELKSYLEKAAQKMPKTRRERLELLRQISGYPANFVERDEQIFLPDENPLDFSRIFPLDEQNEMQTGDIVELTGNRLHDAFYVYRLPKKGIWKEIRRMWSEKSFRFDETKFSDGEEILLICAMDEYGRGVPFLFATTPMENLPDGISQKYVDFNCRQIAEQTENSTIRLVQNALKSRENRQPTDEFIAEVTIENGYEENVLFTRASLTNDLNDNEKIFYSRRILEIEEFLRQKN